jgi:hypothetical protein
MPWREDKDVPKEGEGTGEASRAMEACLLPTSGPGDLERTEEAIGIDLAGARDDPSPLSAILKVALVVVAPDKWPVFKVGKSA